MTDHQVPPDPDEEFQLNAGLDLNLEDPDDLTQVNMQDASDASILIPLTDTQNGPWADVERNPDHDSFGDVAEIEFPPEVTPESVTWREDQGTPSQDISSSPAIEIADLSLAIPPSPVPRRKKRHLVRWTLVVMFLAGSLGTAWWQLAPIVKAHIKYNEGVSLAPLAPDMALECFREALALKPSFPAAECEIAQIHIAQEHWDLASKCIRSAMDADPSFGKAYYLRGLVMLHDQDYNAAIDDFSQSRILGHDIASSLYHRGLAYQARQDPNDVQRAIGDFAATTEIDPSNVDAWFQCGILCFQLGREKEAIPKLDQVLQLQPTHVQAAFYRARSWRKLGEPDNAIRDITRAIDLDPENPIYLEERATLRTEKGDYPGAITDWESMLAVNATAGGFIQLGLLHIKTDQPGKAQLSFTSAIELDPQNALAHGQRGLVHLAAHDLVEAKLDLDRSLHLVADQPLIILASARCELLAGNPDRAIERCSELLQFEPASVEAHLLRGRAHVQNRELDSAIRDFSIAIELNRDLAAAYRFRGQVFFEQGTLSRAVEDLSDAIDIQPDDIPSLLLRGTIYLTLEKPGDAARDFQHVIQLQPKHVGALKGRARAFFLLDNIESSLADFTSALAIAPQDTEALVGRARCHKTLGQLSQGLDDLQAAIAVDPKLVEELKSEQSNLHMQRGFQLLEENNWENALADFTAARRVDKNASSEAEDAMAILYRTRAVHLLVETGPEAALTDLDSCLKLRPYDLKALKLRGDIHVQCGNHRQAIDDYSALLEQNPDDEHALLARGRSRFALAKFKDAVTDFTDAIRTSPTPDVAYIERARAETKLHLYTEAIEDYSQAVAIKAENMSIVGPELAGVHGMRGQEFFDNDRFADAILEFEKALELDRTVAPLVEQSYSLSHYKLGKERVKNNELDDAIGHFDQALKFNPSMVTALVGRGECYLQMKIFDKADTDFTAVIALQPADSILHTTALLGRADVAMARDDPAAAMEDLNLALSLDPAPTDTALMARCYIARGHIRVTRENRSLTDLEDGIRDFEAAIDLDMTKRDLQGEVIIQAFIDLARMETAEFDKNPRIPLINSAISHLLHVLDFDPDATELIKTPLATAFHSRGKLFHAEEDFTSAIEDYQQAIQADAGVRPKVSPDMALAFFQRGILKEGDQAVVDFTEALVFDSLLDMAYVERGRIHVAEGSFPEAIKDFGQAVHIDPDNLVIVKDDFAKAHRLHGEQSFKLDQFHQAVMDFKQALDLDNTLAPLVRTSFSQSYYELAQEGLDNGNLDTALDHFDHALEVDPSMVLAFIGKGRCHLQMNVLDKADADFTAAIRLKPADPVVHVHALMGRAEVRRSLGDPAAAVGDLTTALELRPQPADPHLLADCHQARGYLLIAREKRTVDDLESGIMDFSIAIDLDPAQEKALRVPLTQAYCDLGQMEITHFDEKPSMTLINRAIEHFHQALHVDPQATRLVDEPLAVAHHRRGCLYHSMKAFTSAIHDFEEALRIDKTINELLGPDMAQAYAQRGLDHARRKTTGSLAEGIQDFRTALEFDRDIRPIVQGPLASSLANQAYEKLAQKSTSEAIDLLKAAGDAHPDFKENRALAKLLQYQATVTPEQEVIDNLQDRLSEIHKQPPFQINMQPAPVKVRMALDRQFDQARQLRNSGMLEESLAAMDGIIQQGWGIPFHYYYRGIILLEMKEPEARWKIDFTAGSYLEAQGLQTPDEIGRLLINVQGRARVRLQDQRNLGSSILQQQKLDRQRRRESQFAAAQDETRRYEPTS